MATAWNWKLLEVGFDAPRPSKSPLEEAKSFGFEDGFPWFINPTHREKQLRINKWIEQSEFTNKENCPRIQRLKRRRGSRTSRSSS